MTSIDRNGITADGEKWEIKCAKEEDVTLIGVYIHSDDTSYPSEMNGVKKIKWTWDGIANFIDGL